MSNRTLNSDSLHRRGQAMEYEFFHRVDEKLRANLRAKMQREETRECLAMTTGIRDIELLDHLLDANITPSSIAALALVPIVFVAWADGSVTPGERQAILSTALHRGIKEQPSAFDLLRGWLDERPKEATWNLWKDYFVAVHASLTPKLAKILQHEILQSATAVAEASGQFGRGKVSAAERVVLDKISDAMLLGD